MRIYYIVLAAMSAGLAGCPGSLNEPCRNNGTCNPGLLCDGYYCRLAQPSTAPKRQCGYESECYCVTCAEQCGARGMKNCRFSDTTVWGNHTPATCECNDEKAP